MAALCSVDGSALVLDRQYCTGSRRHSSHSSNRIRLLENGYRFFFAPFCLLESCFQESVTFIVDVVLSIIYVAVFSSIVAYYCWNRGTEMIESNRAGLFINLIPVFASIMAVIWLNESLKLFHIVGMCSIVAGLSMFNRKPNMSLRTIKRCRV
jgi:drug/metabolite transporter (DMT)-like permease